MKRKIVIITVLILIIITLVVNYKTLLRIFYKTEYSEYVEKYSQEYDIDKYLVYSIIKAESNFNSNAQSNKGAIGLMQIMNNTAKEIVEDDSSYEIGSTLFNPEKNIEIGIKYFKYLYDQYGSVELALAAYNGGIGNVDNWINSGTLKSDGSDIENIPFNETNMYVRKTLNNYEMYKMCYE